MPLQATSGAASYDAFGGGVPVVPNYIEECFSCFLHTGTGSAQTITNGIDLSTKGGLVWIKGRNNSWSHILQDTNRGVNSSLTTNNTEKAVDSTGIYVTSFNSNGFSIGPNGPVNFNTNTYVSWAFRKQPKFYTQGTYTGTGSVQNITHDLGSIPAFIIVKDTTNDGSAWAIYHTSLGNTKFLQFTTDAAGTSSGYWNNTSPTSTQFTVGTNGNVNQSGATFVYYAFAHNAGGFGLTGTDNVISCGSYTGNGSTTGPIINLGYEPQWVMVKAASTTSDWFMADTMRGQGVSSSSSQELKANTSGSEQFSNFIAINSTGFQLTASVTDKNGSGQTFIYIAIRRGPMKVPTSGTSVFSPVAQAGNGGNDTVTTGFTTDLVIGGSRTANPIQGAVDRLRGRVALLTANTAAEDPCPSGRDLTSFASNTGFTLGYPPFATSFNYTGNNIYWNFRRAPSFFDEVCYTGTEISGQTFNHNLGVVPEMMIVKARDGTTDWTVYHSALGASARIYLNATNAANTGTAAPWNSTAPTSTVFSLGNAGATNLSGTKFVNYLFATCAGVQYINSYVGDGTTGRTINCGFTGGARFVCIKATSTTGSWWTFDSARGIVTNSDPALQLNSTAAEVTSADAIDTASSGFIVNQEATCSLNASGVSYLVWAIA